MLNIRQLIIKSAICLLVFVLVGCINRLPHEITNELEKIAGKDIKGNDFRINFVALIDSDNGKAKYLLQEDSVWKGHFDEPKPASVIEDITTITVVGVSGITINNIGYKFCNYISMSSLRDNSMKRNLICKSNRFREAELVDQENISEVPIISKHLASKIVKTTSDIDEIGFIVVTDILTGEARLLRHENYIDLPVNLPLGEIDRNNKKKKLPEFNLVNSNSWHIITYQLNPCCSCTGTSTGDSGCSCAKWLPKCS